jgi:hypothetical protein
VRAFLLIPCRGFGTTAIHPPSPLLQRRELLHPNIEKKAP